ncbi:MAG: hypothetical protein U0T36_06530 [Saprospiraceae bacterium]
MGAKVIKSGNIKVSAATHQNKGNDFFAGPLDINCITGKLPCEQWDKIFTVKANISDNTSKTTKNATENGTALSCNEIPEDILYWLVSRQSIFRRKIWLALL